MGSDITNIISLYSLHNLLLHAICTKDLEHIEDFLVNLPKRILSSIECEVLACHYAIVPLSFLFLSPST